MNTADEIKKLRQEVSRINLLLMQIRSLGPVGAHNLLNGGVHPDTTAHSPNEGDIIYGNIANQWTRRARGTDGWVLTLIGGVPDWQLHSAVATEESIAWLDHFNDADRWWGWYDYPQNGTLTEAANTLTIAVANGIAGQWENGVNSGPRCRIGLPGFPCIVETKLNSGCIDHNTAAGLFVSKNPTSPSIGYSHRIERYHDVGLDGIAYNNLGANTATAAVSTMPLWLRIRIATGAHWVPRFYFDYSTDGLAWTNLASYEPSSWDSIGYVVGLHARHWTTNPGVSAPFEYLKLYRSLGPG